MNRLLKALGAFFLLSAGALTCSAQFTFTNIVDTLTNPDGTNFTGSLLITLPNYTVGNQEVQGNTQRPYIINGALNLNLTPNDQMPGNVLYTVTGVYDDGTPYIDRWRVPTSTVPVTLAKVRSSASTAATVDAASIAGGTLLTITGTGSAYIGSSSHCPAALGAGQHYLGYMNVTNSVAAPTLNICGKGAVTIIHNNGYPLQGSELDSTGVRACEFIYNGTNLLIGNGCSTGGSYQIDTPIVTANVPTPGVGQYIEFYAADNGNLKSQIDSSRVVTVIGGGGIGTNAPSTYSAIPSCTSTKFFQPLADSAAYNQAYCDGSSTLHYYQAGHELFLPGVVSGWTFVDGSNGAAGNNTCTDNKGTVVCTGGAGSSLPKIWGVFKATPATPYTKTFKFSTDGVVYQTLGVGCGVGWTNGTTYNSSSIHALVRWFAGSQSPEALLDVARFTDFTQSGGPNASDLFSNNFVQGPPSLSNDYWFRIADDGTNRTFSISSDGDTWIQIKSLARTTFITPTNYGFFCFAKDAASGQEYIVGTVKSIQ